MTEKAHKGHTRTFEELTFSGQAKSLNAQFATLTRAVRAHIAACRKGSGLIAIEDTAIRDEINKVLEALGLMVIEKE